MLGKEIWRTCWYNNKEYKDYKVSNWGRIKRVYKTKEKILKPWKCTSGYYMVTFCIKGVKTVCLVHRLVANAFIPNVGGYYKEVDHRNTIRTDNILENICWVTSIGNQYNPLTHARKKANGNNDIWNKGRKRNEI